MTQAALQLASALHALNSRWQPHPAQQRILNAIFRDRAASVFVECGRKFGKTETIAYFLWRLALLRPGGYYYFAPEQKQAKEIIWAAGRLQAFGPQEFLAGKPNDTEMRIRLINGSFIKVDGSDNFNAYRGIEPHGVAYDEYRDFRPEFHRAFGANLSVYGAPLLLCGTPPEPLELDHYDAMRDQHELGRDRFVYPSWSNPHISREWLKAEREKLIARGETDVWQREYEAKRVIGGSNAIFPMFSRKKHVKPHQEVMAEVWRDKDRLIWQVICDPGNASTFGVLFRAINPYTRRVYRLAEIYEKDQAETSTSRIVPRIKALRDELCPNWQALGIEWEQLYDEAATWFATEALASFGEHFTPTSKGTKDKDQGLSLMKDQMIYDLTVISDGCVSLIKETEGYIRDKNGKIPKMNDHLIDCDRYGNDFASCDLTPLDQPKAPDPLSERRAYTIEQDQLANSDDYELDY